VDALNLLQVVTRRVETLLVAKRSDIASNERPIPMRFQVGAVARCKGTHIAIELLCLESILVYKRCIQTAYKFYSQHREGRSACEPPELILLAGRYESDSDTPPNFAPLEFACGNV